MRIVLASVCLLMGVQCTAYADNVGACVKSPGSMLAYARPDEPKRTPNTSKPIREAATIRATPHVRKLSQPAISHRPARVADGPLRIGSNSKPEAGDPPQIALSERLVACDGR